MKNISKVLSIILLLTFSVIINQCASNQKTDIKPVSFIEKVPETIKKIYFKDGKVIQCDTVWEGRESDILCDKSDDILAYSAEWVDLVRVRSEHPDKLTSLDAMLLDKEAHKRRRALESLIKYSTFGNKIYN